MPAGPTNVSRSLTALASLRLAIGALFLVFAEYKVFGSQFTWGGGIESWLRRFLHDGAYPFMVPVLERLVLPHAHLLAFLVAYGELAIGLSLTLGILVRPASVGGLIYMLALLFASNYPGPHAPFWEYFGASLDHSVLALCFAAFVFAPPEERLSIRRSRWLRKSHQGEPSPED
ncbi:MAG TPA: DoxX family protein [Acidobacteriaceae bacterium]|nr:DoxX family protein [Acidobacteriaceae bacterium]